MSFNYQTRSMWLSCFVGLMLGGILKGATGAGLPIIAVPVIASVFDIRVAVVVMAAPNFLTNLWQIVKYRGKNGQPVLTRNFAIAGGLGAAFGTALLDLCVLYAVIWWMVK